MRNEVEYDPMRESRPILIAALISIGVAVAAADVNKRLAIGGMIVGCLPFVISAAWLAVSCAAEKIREGWRRKTKDGPICLTGSIPELHDE